MEPLAEVWRRASSQQSEPPSSVIAVMAGLALVLVLGPGCRDAIISTARSLVPEPSLWPVTRILVTITHEDAHAAAPCARGVDWRASDSTPTPRA